MEKKNSNWLKKYVEEQQKINKRLDISIMELKKFNIYAEKRLNLHYELLANHEEWLRGHEVRLKRSGL